MTLLTGASSTRTNGRRAAPPVAARRRRVQLPFLGLALLFVVLGAIGFGVLASPSSASVPVLAATRDIAVGQLLVASDVRVVRVSADSGTSLVPSSQQSSIVGRRAAVAIPNGSLLAAGSVRDGPELSRGQAIVSVTVAPGAAPVPDLRVGDRVAVVATGSGKTGGSGTSGVLAMGEVVSVTALKAGPTTSGSVAVSLRVPAQSAALVADAAGADRVRLVLVAPDQDLTASSSGN